MLSGEKYQHTLHAQSIPYKMEMALGPLLWVACGSSELTE